MKDKNTAARHSKEKVAPLSEQAMIAEVVRSVKRRTPITMSMDEFWKYLSGEVLEAAREGDTRFVKILRKDLLAKNELSDKIKAYLLFLEGLAMQAIGFKREAEQAYSAAIKLDSSIEKDIEMHGFEDE